MSRVIHVENLGKRYEVNLSETTGRFRYRTLGEELASIPRWLLGRVSDRSGAPQHRGFWALKEVSFEAGTGEVLGVIGRNGAGKSTLLKLLARITCPTEGRAALRGRVGSLLEVGTGFHPELSGRENIFLNGCILGMSRREVLRKFDEIVAFSEVEPFLDMPVKRYSSGMYVRLAFAVAAHLEPEVLLVDEALAVGDLGFQKKCLGRMGEVSRSGRTILFVSHNLAAVQALCSRCLLLEGGSIRFDGKVTEGLALYAQGFAALAENELASRVDRSGRGEARTEGVRVVSDDGSEGVARMGSELTVVLSIRSVKTLQKPRIGVVISTASGHRLFRLNTWDQGVEFEGIQGNCEVTCEIPSVPLLPGRYVVTVSITDVDGLQDLVEGAASFDVLAADVFGTGRIPQGPGDIIHVASRWTLAPA